MRRNQVIVIAACLALLIAIYFFGNTKKPLDAGAAKIGQGHAQPQQAAAAEALDIDAYILDVKSKADTPVQQTIAEDEKAYAYDKLIETYKKIDKPLAVAFYAVRQAEKVNTAKQFVSAGDYNATLMQTAPDDKARRFLMENVLNCYKKAVDLDSASTDNRIRLAGAYMEEGTQPMSGVLMLLDIVKKDSNNVDAQLMLGRFGLISGQIDKAIARFEKVLYLQPQNSEALFSLAEAYNNKGEKQKAIELLERCKKTVKDPATKKDIEKAIESIKQPKS
jgi:tetratricopeptide (TPR) repeat protein